MSTLIPRDLWEHNFRDLCLGIAAALGGGEPGATIDIPGVGSCIPARSGRSALIAALKSLGLPGDAPIAVPLFCCPVVFKAVSIAGFRPVFIDIDPETFCISAEDLNKMYSAVEAVIAVHMFGNMCDIPAIKAAARGKPIIEDCAQSLGSRLDGAMSGSIGTIGIFSFRSGKYLSVGEGGALFTRDQELKARLSRFISVMSPPGKADELKHLAKTYVKSALRSRPLYGLIGYYLWMNVNRKANLSERSGVAQGRIHRSDIAVARKRLPFIDSFIESQRANAEFFSRNLELDPKMLCSERPGAYYNRYHYPIIFPSQEHRDFVAGYLLKTGIDSMKYLDDIVDHAAQHYGYKGGCPSTEHVSKRTLVVPGYHTLGKNEIKRITDSLNAGWAEAVRILK